MSILLLLMVLAALAVIAVVAAGRGDTLPDPTVDRSPLGVLPPGPVTRSDIDGLRFSLAFRGYRMDEVDAVVERLATEIDALDRRVHELEASTAGRDPGEGRADRSDPAEGG